MIILTDTREQKNKHILNWFDTNGIAHREERLETADYTFILPHYPELNIDRKCLVERKGSLNEVVGNLTKDRDRFIKEFERVKPDENIQMVMENATWKKILNGSYRSEFSPTSYIASLMTICIRYGCPIWFCNPEESGQIIYSILKYQLREHLRNLDK